MAPELPENSAIPAATVPRLSQYLRKLQEIQSRGTTTISSRQLADEVGTNPAQIRKDLSYFGEFGIRGVGYDVDRLIAELKKCLGLEPFLERHHHRFGKAGHGAGALPRLPEAGLQPDRHVRRRSRRWSASDRGAGPVLPIADLEKFLKENEVHIAVVTTPSAAAQEVIDRVVEAGVPSVLNFAPIRASHAKSRSSCGRWTFPPS